MTAPVIPSGSTPSVRERPILFSAPMVRAILEGHKTQTRRIVKPQPDPALGETPGPAWNAGYVDVACRYGKTGDRLWVKETFITVAHGPGFGVEINYIADGHDPQHDYETRVAKRRVIDPCPDRDDRWRPSDWRKRVSIHMPRWASRITLEVTEVRVERLQSISEEDARAEGMHGTCSCDECFGVTTGDPVADYARLWDAINGAGAWALNPWVWAVSFRRIG